MVPETLPVSQKASSSVAIVCISANTSARGRPLAGSVLLTVYRSA
jgi:hypothetical protein